MKIMYLLLAMLCFAGCRQPEPVPTVPQTIPVTQPTVTEPPVSESTVPENTVPADPLAELVSAMTTGEKVGQLFLGRYNSANALSDTEKYHLGGWILFSGDFKKETPDSIRAEISALQALSAVPMLMAVDEEGGTVTRVSRYRAFRDSKFKSPRYLYANGGEELLLETEAEKSRLLSSLGLNVNMGPVCDITTDPGAFMYKRSLGQSPALTGRLIAAMVKTMHENGVGAVLKHFPGYGNNDDTHVGIARDSRSLAALEACDLVPFRAGIDAGCGAILVSHTIVEALDASLPASLSPAVIEYLREEMGYDGVVITDDLAMQAITDTYGAGESAVMAVLAGCDLLCATEYAVQYEAVLHAVQAGRIPMERVEEAVARVLRLKQALGMMVFEG